MLQQRVYDEEDRIRITQALFQWAADHKMKSGQLAQAISTAHPNKPIIDPRRLRRLSNEEHEPDHIFFGWCETFLLAVNAPAFHHEALAKALTAFIGVHQSKIINGDYFAFLDESKSPMYRVRISQRERFHHVTAKLINGRESYEGIMTPTFKGAYAILIEPVVKMMMCMNLQSTKWGLFGHLISEDYTAVELELRHV